MNSYVVAIAGHSGAGKSTIIRHLVSRLGNAHSLSLDEYEESSTYPSTERWLANGADPNEFLIPNFDTDVHSLKHGKTIVHPITGQEVEPCRFLILEEPFGKGRNAVRDLIDLVVYIDTPLEVAYLRKISRKNDFLPWEDNPQVFMKNLRQNLDWYQEVGRKFYLAIAEKVRTGCDLIVDGMFPTEKIVDEIYQVIKMELHKRGGRQNT